MSQETSIQLFENAKIRVIWDDEQEKYFFSVVDVVGVLTEQETARNSTIYWAVVKKRLKSEGADELITNCKQLKLPRIVRRKRFCNFNRLDYQNMERKDYKRV